MNLTERVALDTNVLAYALGVVTAPADQPKIDTARALFRGLVRGGVRPVAPTQALAELHRVLVRKAGLGRADAETRVRSVGAVSEIVGTTPSTWDAALRLATDHHLQIFDAMILAVAAEAGADLLLSEDLHEGFSWRGLVVRNPFAPTPTPNIARLITMGADFQALAPGDRSGGFDEGKA